MKNWGSEKSQEELVTMLGANTYSRSQIKIWLQKFRNGDLSCKDAPRTRRPLLTLEPQLAASLQKYLFATARALAQHFLTSVPTIKEILQRELGLKEFSRRWVPHFLSPTQNVAHVEALTKMLRILRELEENHFEGIAAGDESWFEYSHRSTQIFLFSINIGIMKPPTAEIAVRGVS
jgi:transposase